MSGLLALALAAGAVPACLAAPATGGSGGAAAAPQPPLNLVRSRLPQRGYVPPRQEALNKRSVIPLIDNAPGGYDVEYLVNLAVGTPPQNFTCLFDTGSDILYVPYNCQTTDCIDHSQYSPSSSSTSKSLGQQISIQYGSGSASGTAYQDVVSISNYTVQQQQFVAANNIDSGGDTTTVTGRVSVPTDPSDCLIGISYDIIPSAGTLQAKNFVQNLVSQGTLSSFGMYLTRAEDIAGASTSGNSTANLVSGSELCLGCTDTAKYTGSFSTIPLVSRNYGYWAAQVDGFTLNGQLISNSSAEMLFDSGTTFAALPPATLATIANRLGATQSSTVTRLVGGTGYSIPCGSTPSVSVGVQIGGVNFPFNNEDLVEQLTNQLCGLTLFSYGATDNTGLSGILGQTFLKAVYSQFSYSNGGSIGVAALANNAASTGSSVSSASSPSVTSATTAGKSAAGTLHPPTLVTSAAAVLFTSIVALLR